MDGKWHDHFGGTVRNSDVREGRSRSKLTGVCDREGRRRGMYVDNLHRLRAGHRLL